MHHTVAVRVLERVGQLSESATDVGDFAARQPLQSGFERLALDEAHYIEERVAGLSERIQRYDVRMGELGRGPSLTNESVASVAVHELAAKNLYGNEPLEQTFSREEHGSHPALPEETKDFVLLSI